MMQAFTVMSRLPGANEYIAAAHNHYKRSSLKKATERKIVEAINKHGIAPYKQAIDIMIIWDEKPARNGRLRDKDNVMFGAKFILDALQTAEIIPNDNWDYVHSITHIVEKSPVARVNVLLMEAE